MEQGIGILFLTVAVFFRMALSESCDLSGSFLHLHKDIGQLRPATFPYNFSAMQSCKWFFPKAKFSDKAVLIYIDVMDMQNSTYIMADLTIGESPGQVSMPETNCRLYGKDISNINTSALGDHLAARHGSRGRYCNAWLISNRTLDHIIFRSFGWNGEVFRKKGFFIYYAYIDVQKKENDMETETDSPLTSKDTDAQPTIAATSRPDGITTSLNESITRKCEANQIQIVIIGILAALLLVAIAVLIYLLRRQRKNSSNFKPADGLRESGYHANTAYSGSEKMINRNMAEKSSPPPMYDIPTNNRRRAPTIESVASNMSDHTYQVPTSNRSIIVDEAIPEQESIEVRDLYGVVHKDRMQ